MVAMRKHSWRWGVLVAIALPGILAGYAFLVSQPIQAQFGDSPIAVLQKQVKALQLSQTEQDAELEDLDLRVAILEAFAFGGGGDGGGGGGGGDQDLDNDGYSPNQGDCDDADATTNPGAVEVVDGKDNDCDGLIDEVD